MSDNDYGDGFVQGFKDGKKSADNKLQARIKELEEGDE